MGLNQNDKDQFLDIDEFLKKSHFLKLTNDAAFKAYFKSNKELLISLLTSFLPFPENSIIIEVDILDSELSSTNVSINEKVSDKKFILDLLVRFERRNLSGIKQTETVNVEMQTTSESYFTSRTLAYSCRVYSQQLKKGSEYNKLFPVYSLSFTTKSLKEFKGIKDYYHVCNIRRVEPPEVLMSRGLCFVIVELEKFDKSVKQLYNARESWCYLLKNSHKMSPLEYKSFKQKGGQMAKAVKSLWNLSQEEAEREYLFALEKRERDRISQKNLAREEGLEKGFKEGIEKGVKKGIEQERKAIALNMLKSGIDIQVILDTTKLSREELEQFK